MMINGTVALHIRSKGTLDTLDRTYSTMPTGGVRSPIIRFSIMMIPKWTGSTPMAVTTGRNTGVRMMMDGVESMNMPTNTRNRLINSSAMYLLFQYIRNRLATNCGNRSKERIQQKIVAPHTIIMTVQVVSLASLRACTSFLGVSVR